MGPKNPTYGHIAAFIQPIRTILISRFFINLRNIYIKDDDPPSLSEMRVRIPTISMTDIVGNLGAPIGDHTSLSDSTVMDEPIVARKPMLVGLEASGSGVGLRDLREDDDPVPLLGIRDGLGEDSDDEHEREDEGGSGDDDEESGRRSIGVGPWRQASKSTVDESDTLLVDGEAASRSDEEEPLTPTTDSPRASRVSSMTFAETPRTVDYD